MTVLGIVGVVVVAGALGLGDLGAAVTGRFSSSFETQYDTASMSNFVRIAESLHVISEIIANPWFGYGIGYSFVAREIINFQLHKQWYVHENYLLVTLKQGLIGLGLWIWLMIAFLSSALRGRNLPSPIERAWCMGTAAMCLYLIVYQFVYFPLAEVNTAFMFALALGVMMGLTRTRTLAIRWKAPDAAAAP